MVIPSSIMNMNMTHPCRHSCICRRFLRARLFVSCILIIMQMLPMKEALAFPFVTKTRTTPMIKLSRRLSFKKIRDPRRLGKSASGIRYDCIQSNDRYRDGAAVSVKGHGTVVASRYERVRRGERGLAVSKENVVIAALRKFVMSWIVSIVLFWPIRVLAASTASVVATGPVQEVPAAVKAIKRTASLVFLYCVALPYFFKVTGFRRSLRVGWERQNFLESKPAGDLSQVPEGTYTNESPFVGKIASSKCLTGPKARFETYHLTIDHGGKFKFWEGQCVGILPPLGDDEQRNSGMLIDETPRLYSISSSRYGDDGRGKTLSLCVKKLNKRNNNDVSQSDEINRGLCSDFLCGLKPGDKLKMTGPWVENDMLLREEDSATDFIFVASSTGIASVRGILRRLFTENTKAGWNYSGKVWLFFGAANKDSILYQNELTLLRNNYPQQFGLICAFIGGEKTKDGVKKVYIHDKMSPYVQEIYEKLVSNGAHIYFSGFEEMMPGIESLFEEYCSSINVEYGQFKENLIRDDQWHSQLY